jgi:GNAT superfamily N-acetyltransferase
MNDFAIRQAEDDELGRVAGLRWQWVQENHGTPAMTRGGFVAAFVSWARQHAPSHRCIVATHGGDIVGMAWLAIVPRVPTPQAPERASGDVQCVYVIPRERNSGVGRLIIAAVLELADQLRLERVTVHSSPRAVTAYARGGFAASSHLLQAVAPFPGPGEHR